MSHSKLSGSSLWSCPSGSGNLKNKARQGNATCETYKTFRNKPTYLIRLAKKNFYAQEIEENKGNSRALWKILKHAVDGGRQDTIPMSIQHENRTVSDLHEIADIFNSHFSKIAENLTADVAPSSNDQHMQALKLFVTDRLPADAHFSIPQMQSIFFCNEIQKLSCHKATWVESININLFKIGCTYVLQSLFYVYNLSIRTGRFPEQWKIGKITPIHKSASRQENTTTVQFMSYLSYQRSWNVILPCT